MGAGVSSIMGPEGEAGGEGAETGLGELPESCVAAVLLRLEPREICGAARLSRAFRGAAAADFVWEAKLPENHGYLMSFESEGAERGEGFICKKEIYARLCRPIRFDGGNKEFWMEKRRSGICMAISSKGLAITGVDDRRYWNHISTEESRFGSVAYLMQTWWFEAAGEVDFCFPAGKYSLYFRLHLGRAYRRLGRRLCDSEHVHGWEKKPVQFQLSTADGQHVRTHCHLDEPGAWILYHVGDFVVPNSSAPTRLKFSMTQIDCTHTKGGLCVDSAVIYPKGFRQGKAYKACM